MYITTEYEAEVADADADGLRVSDGFVEFMRAVARLDALWNKCAGVVVRGLLDQMDRDIMGDIQEG